MSKNHIFTKWFFVCWNTGTIRVSFSIWELFLSYYLKYSKGILAVSKALQITCTLLQNIFPTWVIFCLWLLLSTNQSANISWTGLYLVLLTQSSALLKYFGVAKPSQKIWGWSKGASFLLFSGSDMWPSNQSADTHRGIHLGLLSVWFPAHSSIARLRC